MISIIVPIYNEKDSLRELHGKIVDVMNSQFEPYEVIFVDDHSSDTSWEVIKSLKPLRGISLQKNYGNTPALDTGIQAARGDIIVMLDADLQNDPWDILKLLEEMKQGYDVVVGWRKKRSDSWSRRIFSKVANSFVRLVLDTNIHDLGCALKAYKSPFIKDFRLWGNMQIFLVAVAKERGANIGEVTVGHYPRKFGNSKIKISKMVNTIFDLLAVKFVLKYFLKPARFFGGISLVLFVAGIAIFLGYFLFQLTGFPFTAILILVLFGFLFLMLGFLGEAILRLYFKSGDRNLYFVKETVENK